MTELRLGYKHGVYILGITSRYEDAQRMYVMDLVDNVLAPLCGPPTKTPDEDINSVIVHYLNNRIADLTWYSQQKGESIAFAICEQPCIGWEIERLFWIAFHKNSENELCHIANSGLSKDLIFFMLSYLRHPDFVARVFIPIIGRYSRALLRANATQ